MIRSNFFRRAGVTLTELLVVLVIVSILATIAVPVYINKAENARISVAQAECREIADAEETCAAHHGFYVPFQLLNDLPAGSSNNTESDTIDRETSNIYLIDPAQSYEHLDNQKVLAPTSTDPRVRKLLDEWQGPFLNPQRVYKRNATSVDPIQLQSGDKRRDFPLDPWGQPYRFFAPEPFGLIGSSASTMNSDSWDDSFSDGLVTRNDATRGFDRFVVLSYGPNGYPNTDTINSTGRLDDIAYFFGRTNPTQTETNNSGSMTATPTVTP